MQPSPHKAMMWLEKIVCLSVLNCAAAILAAAAMPAALAIPCINKENRHPRLMNQIACQTPKHRITCYRSSRSLFCCSLILLLNPLFHYREKPNQYIRNHMLSVSITINSSVGRPLQKLHKRSRQTQCHQNPRLTQKTNIKS